jgi:hypothetical protein
MGLVQLLLYYPHSLTSLNYGHTNRIKTVLTRNVPIAHERSLTDCTKMAARGDSDADAILSYIHPLHYTQQMLPLIHFNIIFHIFKINN